MYIQYVYNPSLFTHLSNSINFPREFFLIVFSSPTIIFPIISLCFPFNRSLFTTA